LAPAAAQSRRDWSYAGADVDASVFKRSTASVVTQPVTEREGVESGNDILEVPRPIAITGVYSNETKTNVAVHPV